jgi:hypothetical protein
MKKGSPLAVVCWRPRQDWNLPRTVQETGRALDAALRSVQWAGAPALHSAPPAVALRLR